jgi:hypothetical protein
MSDLNDIDRTPDPNVDAMLRRVLGSERLTPAERARHRARLMASRRWRIRPPRPTPGRWDADDEDAWSRAPVLLELPVEHGGRRRGTGAWVREVGKLAAAALVFILVGAVLALTLRGDGEDRAGVMAPTPTPLPTPAVTVTPRSVEPSARIDVGPGPHGIAAGAGAV